LKNIILSLHLIFIVSSKAVSQEKSKFYFLGGVDFSGNSYSYARHKEVLRSSDPDISYTIYNFHGAFQYRPKQTFSIETGIQLQEFINMCLDTAYLIRNPQNRNALLNLSNNGSGMSQLGFDIYYVSYYITATKYFPLNHVFSFYTSGGLSTDRLHRGSPASGVNTFYDNTNNETLQLKYTDVHQYYGNKSFII
jgi:hypothetical protein